MKTFIGLKTKTKLFRIPAKVVAEHRASNYEKEGTKEFKEEVEFALDDSYALEDWFYNNTDPCDFKKDMEFVKDIKEEGDLSSWDDYEEIEFLDT